MERRINLTNSLLKDLVTEYSDLRPQIYFKSSLIALARAMQDIVLADSEHQYLIIANFQKEQFFRQAEQRFQQMADRDNEVYILGVPDVESSFATANCGYETIPTKSTDTLAGERYLAIVGQEYSACMVVREKLEVKQLKVFSDVEETERFEGIWSFDRDLVCNAADWLLGIIANYRPELKQKTQQARELFKLRSHFNSNRQSLSTAQSVDLGIFTQRLVTYIQAGQYKLLKAYDAIATAKDQEQLINEIAQAQRNSLNIQEILAITVEQLGKVFARCRCILYPIDAKDTNVTIEYESVPTTMPSLLGEQWSIKDNPLFLVAQTQDSALAIDDVAENTYFQENSLLGDRIKRAAIDSWLMVSIRYQKTLLGVLELHYSGKQFQWQSEDIALVEAVANSTGVALTQASAYTNLVELNQQLETLEHIQSNLIAVVGHELRTPLSTIRICLESLADEPDMPSQVRETMLDTALSDSDRLGQLIQDFLTLSKLEAKKAYLNIESIQIEYPLNLALHRIKRNSPSKSIPEIEVALSPNLPNVLADIEGLVEVFYKLLDNARKFTSTEGKIFVTAKIQHLSQKTLSNSLTEENLDTQKVARQSPKASFKTSVLEKPMLEIIIADTGRGIEVNQLQSIFDRFSQSENYLRRTVSGAGLGLAICRQIINSIGGTIWAMSEGKDRGSQFHFMIPIHS